MSRFDCSGLFCAESCCSPLNVPFVVENRFAEPVSEEREERFGSTGLCNETTRRKEAADVSVCWGVVLVAARGAM